MISYSENTNDFFSYSMNFFVFSFRIDLKMFFVFGFSYIFFVFYRMFSDIFSYLGGLTVPDERRRGESHSRRRRRPKPVPGQASQGIGEAWRNELEPRGYRDRGALDLGSRRARNSTVDPRQSSQQLRLHGRRARVRRRGLACRDVLQELRRRQGLARWNDQQDSCRHDPADGSVGQDLARALSE